MMLTSISFIIIGKNEGWKLLKCLESVFSTIEKQNIKKYEVIYIDSKSNDGSIDAASAFNINICLLTGDCNAAIARNVGASIANSDVLFFIDGDMELISENFNQFFDPNYGLKHPFLSGNLIYYYYDNKWKFLFKNEDPHFKITTDTYQAKVGGVFFIQRQIWEEIGGMKSYLAVGEDPDLAFRLLKKKIFLLRKPSILVKHHTISYLDSVRKWNNLLKISANKAVLYRENLNNYYSLKQMLVQDYSSLILFLTILFIFFHHYIIAIYFIVVLIRVIKKKKNIFSNLTYFILRDVSFLYSFFLHWPAKIKNTNFTIIKQNKSKGVNAKINY